MAGRHRSLSTLRVLRHGDFTLVTVGNFVSQLGTWSQNIGIGWAASRLTHSSFLVGIAFGAQFVPNLILAPFGGLVADRYDRRMITIVGNIGMALPAAAIGLMLYHHSLTLVWLIILAFLGGVMTTFTQPASSALIPHLVPLEDLAAAVSVNSTLQNATRFVGAALAGYIIREYGTAAAFQFNAISFFAVVVAWLVVRPTLPHFVAVVESFGSRLGGGLKFARENATVRNLLLINAATTYFVMQQPLLPIITRDMLHSNPGTYGNLNSATGLGAIAGAFIAGQLVTDARRRVAMACGTFAATASVFGVAFSHWIPLSLLLQVLFGLGYFTVITVSMTVMMVVTPDDFRGRVLALQNLSLAGMIPLMSLTAGFLASWLGITTALLLAGSMQLAAALWFVFGGGLAAIRFDLQPDEPAVTADEVPAMEAIQTVEQ